MTKKLPFKVVQHPVPTKHKFVTNKGFTFWISNQIFWHYCKNFDPKNPDAAYQMWMGVMLDPKLASDILWNDYIYLTTGEFPK